MPKHAHGTANLGRHTSSTKLVMEKVLALYDRIVDPDLLVRRINLSVNHLIPAEDQQEKKDLEREKNIQHAMIDIKKKYGKNAILKGMNLQEGATAKDRNRQIGGHRA